MVSAREAFSQFRAAVARYFAPVAAELDLGPAKESELYPELYISFSGPSTQLVVALDAEWRTWVYVGVVAGGRQHEFGLHTLVEDAEGSFAAVTDVDALPSIDAQVHALAELTRRYAAAFLRGDVSRLSVLRQLRAKAHRERNRKLAGTPSGAFPPGHRPALAELFAEAEGAEFPADVRLACVYAAVWDHEYSAQEVANFLRVKERDVKRIVDALDNLTDESLEELRAMIGSSG